MLAGGTRVAAQPEEAPALPSLQSFSGLWYMPTARVLPDWNVRIKYGKAEPYRYYGVALGLFDRMEISGQFTETSSVSLASIWPEYGYHKDRSAGARLVLSKEKKWFPQIAAGVYDPVGTLLFPSRYLVASKQMGTLDFTLGMGQGLLGGQSLADITREQKGKEALDTTFLFSSPFRPSRLFGGAEYHYSPDLTFTAEYSSLKYEGMFGSPAKADIPLNFGVKYRPWEYITLQGGWMRGQELAIGLAADMPLSPEGMLVWKKEKPYESDEQRRWLAHNADDWQLAMLLGKEIRDDGFSEVAVSVRDSKLWIEAANSRYLSDARAMGRLAQIADALCPEDITTWYLNLTRQGQIRQSLKTSRANLLAFMNSRLDKEGFLTYGELDAHATVHHAEFFAGKDEGEAYRPEYDWYSFTISPRVKTFLNNKNGFFKHKAVLQPRLKLFPRRGTILHAEMDLPLYNEWDSVDYAKREPEPTRTDLTEFEASSSPRLTILALEQYIQLPAEILGRVAGGYFESAYAGIGGEVFRFFRDGLYGIGVESEIVRKRDPDDTFRLHPTIDKNYTTAFLNLYAQLVPSLGIEGGLKLGRFLGGDTGFEIELRRSWKYFTIGGWYTTTASSGVFSDPYNVGSTQKGVYIRVPLSLFADRELRGKLLYTFTSFTRDAGATVSQPSRLFPMDPYGSADSLKRSLNDMRRQ
ncbi:MAG: YjbH domain-containing protein [Thermodesulfobacteriota bacterium]